MHAGLSNWRWFRTLVWLIGQVPTLDLDPNCPLLPFFWFSRISLSSSFGPHVDFSQRDLKVVHTQERQEHKHHFAWKKSWCLLSKDGEIETPKPCRVFFEKEEVSKVLRFRGIFEQLCKKDSSWGSHGLCSCQFPKLSIEPPQSYKSQKTVLLSKYHGR